MSHFQPKVDKIVNEELAKIEAAEKAKQEAVTNQVLTIPGVDRQNDIALMIAALNGETQPEEPIYNSNNQWAVPVNNDKPMQKVLRPSKPNTSNRDER